MRLWVLEILQTHLQNFQRIQDRWDEKNPFIEQAREILHLSQLEHCIPLQKILHRRYPFVWTLYIYLFRISILTSTYIYIYIYIQKKKMFLRSNSSSDEHYVMICVSLHLSQSLSWFPIHFFKNKCKQSTVVYLFSLAPDKRHNW